MALYRGALALAREKPLDAGTSAAEFGTALARLTHVDASVPRVSLLRLSGLVEYEPDEFTFTARAGTTIRELEQALGARGQYLPFDPW